MYLKEDYLDICKVLSSVAVICSKYQIGSLQSTKTTTYPMNKTIVSSFQILYIRFFLRLEAMASGLIFIRDIKPQLNHYFSGWLCHIIFCTGHHFVEHFY